VQVAIPSYLLAIAVGDLEERRIGPLSRVWSEPSVVDAAAYEFQNTDRYLQTGCWLEQ
jgi:leukotriene-A4 hydrolase